MRVLHAAALIALLAGPAYAQMEAPHINLLTDAPSKTEEQIEQEQTKDKAYKESLKKIPDAKVSSDPWGGVRNGGEGEDKSPQLRVWGIGRLFRRTHML
jgi:hypothetical protein